MTQHDVLVQIRQFRKNRKIVQSDMAARLNIALKTYQNIENGTTRIDIERLAQIAEILELTLLVALLEKETQPPVDSGVGISWKEKRLYDQIIAEKEKYIAQLERLVHVYQKLVKDARLLNNLPLAK